LTVDIYKNSRQQEIYTQIAKILKGKDLLKTTAKIEHSKQNEKKEVSPQATKFTNIPHSTGDDMVSDTYGRAQILSQEKQDLRTIITNITKGRITNTEGKIGYKDTYEKTEN